MKIRAPSKTQGFTLIEIMVALFLLGIIVAAVYSSWLAIMRGAQTGIKAAAAVQRSRIAIRTLEDALTSARSFQSNLEYYSFEAENGNGATLSFVSRLSKSFPRSGKFGDFDVRRVTFSLEPGSDSSLQLVLRQNPIFMELDIDEREHPIVLARDVKRFEMEFWDTRKGEFIDEWTETNSLPKMVKVTLEFGGGRESKVREEAYLEVSSPAGTVATTWQGPGIPVGGTSPQVTRPGQQPNTNPGGTP